MTWQNVIIQMVFHKNLFLGQAKLCVQPGDYPFEYV